jgi:hypothetical protein
MLGEWSLSGPLNNILTVQSVPWLDKPKTLLLNKPYKEPDDEGILLRHN